LYGKIWGVGISGFFRKNPSKMKNFWVKGGANPPSGYAAALNIMNKFYDKQ